MWKKIRFCFSWIPFLSYCAGRSVPSEPPSVRVTEEESAVDFCCVSDSGRGSGAAAGHPGWSALCSLQTGRAAVQKQGTGGRMLFISSSPTPLPLQSSLLFLSPLNVSFFSYHFLCLTPPPSPFSPSSFSPGSQLVTTWIHLPWTCFLVPVIFHLPYFFL